MFENVCSLSVTSLSHVLARSGPSTGNNHGLPNNQPYAAGHPKPYVSNAQQGGEEKVEEDMPIAIGVPLEK